MTGQLSDVRQTRQMPYDSCAIAARADDEVVRCTSGYRSHDVGMTVQRLPAMQPGSTTAGCQGASSPGALVQRPDDNASGCQASEQDFTVSGSYACHLVDVVRLQNTCGLKRICWLVLSTTSNLLAANGPKP